MIRGKLIYVLAFFAYASLCKGKLPELDAVYWGTAYHRTSQSLVPASTGQIVIQAKLSGVTIAQSVMTAGSNAFVLKVPMDDGVDPRLPGTARFGERVHIIIRNTVQGIEYETTVSAGTGLSLPTVKGAVTPQNLAVTGNLAATQLGIQSFALWTSNFSGGGVDLNDPNLDSDGDGVSNYQEFLAGTDPLDRNDRLQILEMKYLNGVTSIRFGPIKLSRIYTIYSSPDLTVWTKVVDIVPNVAAASRWHDHAVNGAKSLFYKVEVGIQ